MLDCRLYYRNGSTIVYQIMVITAGLKLDQIKAENIPEAFSRIKSRYIQGRNVVLALVFNIVHE